MMRVKNLINVCIVLLMMTMFQSYGLAAETKFSDVNEDNWAFESVEWAAERGLIKGYSDGSFKPNNILTESQFAAIMTRYYNPDLEKGLKKNELSDAHYDYLKKSGVFLPGHTQISKKNKVVTRLQLAKALYASRGLTGTDKEVIDWMYTNNITAGKGSSKDKYEDFAGNDALKRAHVSAFFYKMDRLGFWIMASETSEDELRGDALYNAILPLFSEKQYTLVRYENGFIQGRSMSVDEATNNLPRIDIDIKIADQLFIGNLTPKYMSSVELVSKTIIAFGVKADPAELATKLHEFAISHENGKKTIKYGDYSIRMEMLTTFIAPLNKYYYHFMAYVDKRK
jgi:hypothetical protein